MTKGKDLTNPTSAAPANINRDAIQKQNRELARDLWQGKLSPREKQALSNLSIQYGLDPLQKQLLCLGGNFYVTVGGLKVIAERNDNPPSAIQLQPATMDERMAAGITQNDPNKPDFVHFWKALLFKSGSDTPYIEYGEASPKDIGIQGKSGGAAKEKDVRAVARTRATGRVLRNAYSIGLPLAEDAPVDIAVIEAEVVNTPDTVAKDAPDTEKPASKAQIGKIHVLKKTAIDNGAIDEDAYYQVLSNAYGVEHTNELTLSQASDLIKKLDKVIADNEPPEEPDDRVQEPIEDFFQQ